MSTQTISGQSFPAPCKHCGGVLYRQVDFCPYCGTVHPLDTGPSSRLVPAAAASVSSAAGRAVDALRTPGTLPAVAAPDIPASPLDQSPPWRGRGTPVTRAILVGAVVLVALVLAYLVYAKYGDNRDWQSTPDEHAVRDEQTARSTTGAIAPYEPEQSDSSSANMSSNAPVSGGGGGGSGSGDGGAPAAPPAAAVVKPAPLPAAQFRDVPTSLQAARASLQANDLTHARSAVNAVLAMQAGNEDAQHLQRDLAALEQRRDSLLQSAQTCVKERVWSCVRHSASDALAIDTGSPEARTLLERAIRESGWAPLPGSSVPRAGNPSVAPETAAH